MTLSRTFREDWYVARRAFFGNFDGTGLDDVRCEFVDRADTSRAIADDSNNGIERRIGVESFAANAGATDLKVDCLSGARADIRPQCVQYFLGWGEGDDGPPENVTTWLRAKA